MKPKEKREPLKSNISKKISSLIDEARIFTSTMHAADLEAMPKKNANKILKKDPKLCNELEFLTSVFNEIIQLREDKEYDKMLMLLNDALVMYPENLDLIKGKAWTLCALGYYEECLEFCNKCLKKHKGKELIKWKKTAEQRMKDYPKA